MPVLLSYRNQSIDLQSKSIDWFLYEGKTGISWVKSQCFSLITEFNYFSKNTIREGEGQIPAGIYMFKVNNRNTTKWCEICSKLAIKIP